MGDVMNFTSKFTTGLISKFISKKIFKNTGYKVDVSIKQLKLYNDGQKINVHLEADGKLSTDDLNDIALKFM